MSFRLTTDSQEVMLAEVQAEGLFADYQMFYIAPVLR